MTSLIDIVDLSSDLSSDYEKLYESNKYTDVSINVGKEPGNKIFFAHAVVLCTRSTYFEKMIVENTEEFQRTVMTFEDVTSEVFEIIFRYCLFKLNRYTIQSFRNGCILKRFI